MRTQKLQTVSRSGNNKHISALLRGSASVLALSAAMVSAFAQTTPSSDSMETVVVTGIRASLSMSQEIKRTSDVIVDLVSAEDIGALPDRSVTEALQRIPGVNISRFVGNNDTNHFSVEGFGVTIRGLGMTRSELNGRDVFSADSGRGLYFGEVASELVGGVDVFKSPSASAIEGGIGGTVNLKTRLPFDSQDQVIAFSADYTYGDLIKKGAPTGSVLYSNQWNTSIGRIGFLADVVYSHIKTRTDGIQIQDYECLTGFADGAPFNPSSTTSCYDPSGNYQGKGIYVPQGASVRETDSDHQRKGYAAAVQWASNDDTMLATFQYLRSDSQLAWTEHAIEMQTDNISSRGGGVFTYPEYGTSINVDSNGVFTQGTLSSKTSGWGADGTNYPEYGLLSNNIRRDDQGKYTTSDYSFNFRWTPDEEWGFNLDVQRVESNTDYISFSTEGQTSQDVYIKTNGSALPDISFLLPSLTNGVGGNPESAGYAANANLSSPNVDMLRAFMDHIEHSYGTEQSEKLDGEYVFQDNDWLHALKFGVRYAERDQTIRNATYNWDYLSAIWANTGPIFAGGNPPNTNYPNNTVPINASDWTVFSFNNFYRNATTLNLNGGRTFTSFNAATNYSHAVAIGSAITLGHGPNDGCNGWDGLAGRICKGVIPGTPFLPSEINQQDETNTAFYTQLDFLHKMGESTISGNIGVRDVFLDRNAPGFLQFPTYTNTLDCTLPSNATDYTCLHTTAAQRAALAQWGNGATINTTGKASMNYLLPSLNVKIEATPDLQFRISLSQSINQSDMGLTRSYADYGINSTDSATYYYNGQPTANLTQGGNPQLKPIHSDNVDLSAEWYFAPNGVGSVTLDLFTKELTDVVTNSVLYVPVTNNGQTLIVQEIVAGNSKAVAKLNGFEFGYQELLNFLPGVADGLGINANYTFIDSHGIPQSTLNPQFTSGNIAFGATVTNPTGTVDTTKLPYEGLSRHNFNFALFYEKYGISARVAYDWRSDFVVTAQDVIDPYQPIMQKAGGQVDASFFYSLTDNLKVGVQGQNLNNETTRLVSIVGPNLLQVPHAWYTNDRRVSFVVRGQF